MNPVEYAENVLNVHEAYEAAQDVAKELEKEAFHHADWQASVRYAYEEMENLEADIVSDERAANSELSQAAFDRHIKIVLQQNDDMKRLRHDSLEALKKRDRSEANMEALRARLSVLTSRLQELGGLLAFYAAAKYAGSVKKNKKNNDTDKSHTTGDAE